jgi:NADH-quinone oxidoreductase subunit M
MPFVIFLTVVNVVYGAFIALVQTDFKYVIGFSSVSHMGMVSMGFATLNAVGMSGAALQMFSHGVMTALFFAVVGMVYDRTHTRQIPELGGLAKILPLPALAFIIGGFVSMGLPGFSGFWAEFQIFSGLWKAGTLTWQLPVPAAPGAPLFPQFLSMFAPLASWWTNALTPWWSTSFTAGWNAFFGWWPAMGSQTWWYPWIGVISVLGVLVTAAYVLRVVRNVFFGPLPKAEYAELPPINALDKFSIVFLSAILIVIGLFPTVIMNMISSGVQSVLTLLGGA